MPFDLEQIRAHFPSLDSGTAHFDGPGGTQTPDVVGLAIASTLTGPLSNRGRSVASEVKADEAVLQFRRAFADFLNVDPQAVVYGRSATQLTYDFSRHLSRQWGPGDEVIVTRLDHDSNVRPWVQAAERQGATVRWIGFDPETAELNLDELEQTLNSRTRLVAVTAASNLLGTMPGIAGIAGIAGQVHDAGALLYVDGVHYAAHNAVDLQALGADFFVCSPYKFLGPHCAVLAAAPSLLESIHPDKLLPSTNTVPERFEFGTLPYEIMAGAAAAVDFIASLGPEGSRRERLVGAFEAIESHEQALQDELERALETMPGVVTHSTAKERTSTMLLTFDGHTPQQVSSFLAERNILAPAGSFYALEASRALGLDDDGGLRIGLAPYTSRQDIRRLIEALAECLQA